MYNEGGYPLLAWEAEASTPIATPITTIEPSESTTTEETTTTTESTTTTTQTTTTTTTQSTTTTNTTTTEKSSCAFTLKEPYTGDLYVGNTFQLEYDTKDGYTGGAAWHTSDSTVATISQTGEVTIVAEGTVTIYVMDDNGNTSSITFTTFTLRTTATTETTTTETTTTAIGNSTQCGDVDLDGYVTLADAILLNKSLVSGIQLNAEQTANTNVYADDKITSIDAMYLLKFIVQVIETISIS
ncbi:MAG: Ig-like domain-containing protein [Ruminococcus sp.]|nr:Ig-like domain-containing protein [Ruminococcus sp.]